MRKDNLQRHILSKHTLSNSNKSESKHNKKNFYKCIECNIISRYDKIKHKQDCKGEITKSNKEE